jgi:hypothetical protein
MVTLVIGMVTLLLALGLTFLPVPGIPMFSAPLMTVRAIIVAVGLVIWWEVWRRRGQEVRTDDSRITWSPRHDREVTMPWSQVHAVRERVVLTPSMPCGSGRNGSDGPGHRVTGPSWVCPAIGGQ